MEIFIMMQKDQSHTGIMTKIRKIYPGEPKILTIYSKYIDNFLRGGQNTENT